MCAFLSKYQEKNGVKQSKSSHHSSQASAGLSVSCLCRRRSARAGCDCSVSSRSGGGVASAWPPARFPSNSRPAALKPPCCLISYLKTTNL